MRIPIIRMVKGLTVWCELSTVQNVYELPENTSKRDTKYRDSTVIHYHFVKGKPLYHEPVTYF